MQQEPNKMKPNQKDELEKKTDNEFVRKFAEEKYKYAVSYTHLTLPTKLEV